MRVLLNELTAVRQRAGIGHYVAELLAALRARANGDEISTYPGALAKAGMAGWNKARRLLGRSHGLGRNGDSIWKARVHALGREFANLHFRAFWAGRSFDLYHEPNYIPLPCDRPTVATVHDLSVLLHPKWHPADRVAYYEKHFAAGLKRCAQLIAVSEFTRRELIENFHVPAHKITVTYNGIRRGLRRLCSTEIAPVRRRLGLPETFLLHVGTLEPRKNLVMLMKAFVSLPRALRERCPLLLAGGWGWNVAAVARYFEDVARHEGVRHIGYVGDAELPALYSAARALVFPSFYEGFGLPPVEMLACGGAVLASTAAAVVETVGAAAQLLHPLDQDGWRTAMMRIIETSAPQLPAQEDIENLSEQFTWERCARATWQVYRTVAEMKDDLAQAA